jgi:predicted choloylglycine hydrolase
LRYGYEWEELSGSHREIGQQHGSANGEHMRYLLDAFEVDLSAPWKEEELLGPLSRHLPGLAEEIQGIAEGSGLSMREVCALSFLVDLTTGVGSSCTGVVFATGPDGPVVGKTSDCTPGVQEEWLRPRRVRPDGEIGAVTHSHVGTPNAEMGMNEEGLSLGISGLLSRQTDPNGVGWQQDIRAVLHACATTREAIDMLRSLPIRHAGYAIVIGDASGDVAIVEKVVGMMAVRRTENNVAFEANIPLSPEVEPFVDRSWGGDNGRGRTALLEEVFYGDGWSDISAEGMIELFSTHGKHVGLCQHGPELHSHTGFFMLPAKRELWLARGYTCQRRLEHIHL